MRDRSWIVPGLALTALTGGTALFYVPDVRDMLPALSILPAWMTAAAMISAVCSVIGMAQRGVRQPIDEIRSYVRRERHAILLMTAFMLLAGVNLISFLCVKQLLNVFVPFRADPLLAGIDHAIFLGNDPWRLVRWLNFPGAGLIYHPLWFIGVIFALLSSASSRPSPEKAAVMTSYFTLWSLVGPAIHMMLPAAGPIFYERLGYGARFAGLTGEIETKAAADYLWSVYSSHTFRAASGISAMPSLHVAMSCWTLIACHYFAPRLRRVAVAAWALIFAMSVALGWHYVLDGIIGSLAAFTCHFAFLRFFRGMPRIALMLRRYRSTGSTLPQPSPVGSAK